MKRRDVGTRWLGTVLVLTACSTLPQLARAETPVQPFKRAAAQHARSSLKHHAVDDVRGPDSAGRGNNPGGQSVRAAEKFKAVHKREAHDGTGNDQRRRSLTASCSSHTDCESDEYCDNNNQCWGCNWCSLLDDAIGGAGTCPSQCSTSSDVCFSHSTCDSDEYCDAWLTCDACSNCARFDDSFDGKCPSACSSSSLDAGVVAGIVVGCVAAVAGVVTLIAFLCKCCCFRPRQMIVMQQQQPQLQYPVYAMQQQQQQQQPVYAMQQPRVVVVPAGAK